MKYETILVKSKTEIDALCTALAFSGLKLVYLGNKHWELLEIGEKSEILKVKSEKKTAEVYPLGAAQ